MKKSNKQQKLYFPADIISGGNQLLLVCLKAGVKIAPQIGWMMVNIHKLCRRRLNGNNLHCAILQNTWRGNSLIQMPPPHELFTRLARWGDRVFAVFFSDRQKHSPAFLWTASCNTWKNKTHSASLWSRLLFKSSVIVFFPCNHPSLSQIYFYFDKEKNPTLFGVDLFFEDKRRQSWVFRSNSRSQNMN